MIQKQQEPVNAKVLRMYNLSGEAEKNELLTKYPQ